MYYATVKHHSTTGVWGEIKANSLTDAKRKASLEYGKGYLNHEIHLIKLSTEEAAQNRFNDIPPHVKVIGGSGWTFRG